MDNPNPTAKIEDQTRDQTAKWLESVTEMIRSQPGSPSYPLSVLLLASSLDDASSKLHWMTLADTKVPNRPNGWAQALYMSRDLLLVLARLDEDFKLGMHLLPAVIAAHPLFQKYAREQPAPPSGRTVTELVVDGAQGKGGAGNDE